MSDPSPIFLSVEAVLHLHRDAIERYGGDIGDRGLLESAVPQPKAGFGGEFVHRDLAEMAAAYLFHIAQNHAFVDGNKRAAAYAAAIFLDMNGLTLTCSDAEYEGIVLSVAKGELGKQAIAEFFRSNTAHTESDV